jgi:hypothetical protein
MLLLLLCSCPALLPSAALLASVFGSALLPSLSDRLLPAVLLRSGVARMLLTLPKKSVTGTWSRGRR